MAAIRNVLTQADGSQQLDDRVSQTNYLEETGSSTTSRVCWTRSIHARKFWQSDVTCLGPNPQSLPKFDTSRVSVSLLHSVLHCQQSQEVPSFSHRSKMIQEQNDSRDAVAKFLAKDLWLPVQNFGVWWNRRAQGIHVFHCFSHCGSVLLLLSNPLASEVIEVDVVIVLLISIGTWSNWASSLASSTPCMD